MKVLIISPLPPPVGGIASWTLHFLDFFSKTEKGYEVLHFNSAIRSKRITDSRMFIRIYSGVIDFFNLFIKLRRKLKDQNPEAVHLTSSASFALCKDIFIGFYLRKKKIRSIIHFRFGRIPDLKQNRNWEWILLKQVLMIFDEIIVLDTSSFNILRQESKMDKVHLIPNPISGNIKNSTNIENRDPFKILFVGHITRKKGVYDLVEAVSKIGETILLKLVGPVEAEVKFDLISMAGENVNLIFPGPFSQEGVQQEMESCGIFILPSHTEGFPNVIIEAMVLGCPIISTQVGAVPDLLEPNRGICIPIKSPSHLEQAIKFYWDNPSKAKEYGENARNYALNNLQIEKIITRIEKIWFAN